MNTILSNNNKLDEQQFNAIRDFIYEVCGIYFKIEKKYLIEEKILSHINTLSLKSIDEYITYLKFHPGKDKELKVLYDFITINETSFFRNSPQITAFGNEVLPELIKNSKAQSLKSLRFWSAGCSSGEEPYTLSIVINKNLKSQIKEWAIEISATDISMEILSKAKEGIYTEYALRNTDRAVIKECFDEVSDKKFKIKDIYRRLIRFNHLNLQDESKLSRLLCYDVIFCRNVLIYFDTESKKKVINKYYELLKPGGYLFLGHSESLHGLSGAFKLQLFKGALAYKKE